MKLNSKIKDMRKSWKMKLCKQWQKRLNLSDWTIVFKVDQDKEDLDLENVSGEAIYVRLNKSAIIRVIDKDQYPKECILPFNFEKTLVHELLHLKFNLVELMTDGSVEDIIVHRLIEDMANILVEKENKK